MLRPAPGAASDCTGRRGRSPAVHELGDIDQVEQRVREDRGVDHAQPCDEKREALVHRAKEDVHRPRDHDIEDGHDQEGGDRRPEEPAEAAMLFVVAAASAGTMRL